MDKLMWRLPIESRKESRQIRAGRKENFGGSRRQFKGKNRIREWVGYGGVKKIEL